MKRKSPTPWLPFSRLLLRLSDISLATWDLACENIRFSSLFAAEDVGYVGLGFPWTTSLYNSVKLSGQTYFCSDISHQDWPEKHRLRLIAIKVPPPALPMMFKYETSKLPKHLFYMRALILMEEKWNACMVQQNQYHIWAYNYRYCFSSTSYIRLVMKLMKLTEACNLVDFHNNTS